MFRKIVKFIITMLLSWVILIGGVAAVGYTTIMKEDSAGKLANTVGGALGKDVQLSDEAASLSIYQYVLDIIQMVGSLGDTQVGELEGYLGMPLLSDNLNDAIGLDKDVATQTAIGDLPETISANITLTTATEKFGIKMPDMPLFEDEEFKKKPLSDAFGDMTSYKLENFLKVTYTEDATETNPASPIILQKFAKYSLDEINKDSQKIINSFTLGDMMKITEESPKILKALQDNTVETQYNEDGTIATESIANAINTLPLKDIMDVGNTYIWKYLGDYSLKELGKAVDNMRLCEAIEITENTHPLLKQMKDCKISRMGAEIAGAIKELTFNEMMDIDAMKNPSPILIALRDTKIKDATTKLNSLTVSEVYGGEGYGVLSLVPGDTLLTNMPAVLLANAMNKDIYTLNSLRLVSVDLSSSSAEQKAYVYNSTLSELVSDMPGLLNGTLNVSPSTIYYSSSTLTQAELDSLLGFQDGATLVLQNNVTIPDDEVFTSRFNVKTGTMYSLTIGNNVAMDIDGGYGFISGNVSGSVIILKNIHVTSTYSVPAYLMEVSN